MPGNAREMQLMGIETETGAFPGSR